MLGITKTNGKHGNILLPRFITQIATLCILLSCSFCASGQIFPVQVNTQITPPYSPFLSDYTTPGSQRLMTQIIVRDLSLDGHNVKLRLTIEGLGITIRTKSTFVPQPIALEGAGTPLTLYGEDLQEYFKSENLDFAGYSKKEFDKTGKLPEGAYRFGIEVCDYNRGTAISNRGAAVVWMILNDPPLLNLPRKDSKVKIIDPTNIAFTWTPRHTSSPNSAFTTEYIFRLVEIWPANRNPYDAFLSQVPLYELTTTQSQIIYGLSEPALIPGRRYAWQVQARDVDGKDLFKNQGRSEVYVFQFGDAIGTPENLRQEARNATALSLRWEPSPHGDIPDQYRLKYKPQFKDKWHEVVTDKQWITLSQLQPNTAYDVQIRAEKLNQQSDYSAVKGWNTAEKKEDDFKCGQPEAFTPPDFTASALLTLHPGDVVAVRDFKLVVTEVTKSANGFFSGNGLMSVNLFNKASVWITFNIGINNKYQMTSGEVESIYEKGSEMGSVTDEMYKIGDQNLEETETDNHEGPEVEATYIVTVEIVSVAISDGGTIVVTDEEGNETEYEQKKVKKKEEPQPTIIQDASGDQWIVQKDPTTGETTVTKVAGNGLQPGTTTAQSEKNAIKEKILRLILADFKSEISAWLQEHGKGPLDDQTLALIMAMPECFPQDLDILQHIHDNTIPYYENDANTSELREKIETNQTNKELLDKVSVLFSSISAVDITTLSEDNTEATRNATCSALMELAETETITTELKSNGTVISAGAYALITAVPAMPAISVKAISSNPNSNTEVSFRLKIEYRRDIRQDEDFFPTTEAKKIKVNQKWDVDFGDKIRGGKATLYCDYGTTKDTIIFYIRGTNPTEQSVKDYINTQNYDVWFFTRMIRQESNYRQFNPGTNYGTGWNDSQGCPNFGPPHGWGLMQLDLLDGGQRPTAQQLWSWKANVDRGHQFLNGEKRTMVNNRLNAATNVLNLWYEKSPEDIVQGHADQVEGNITYTHANSTHFDFNFGAESGQSKPFADAAWIKNYNGSSGGTDGYPGFYYLIKRIGSAKPFWDVQRVNNSGHNYVEAVSNRAE
jgi:hypothetical protein